MYVHTESRRESQSAFEWIHKCGVATPPSGTSCNHASVWQTSAESRASSPDLQRKETISERWRVYSAGVQSYLLRRCCAETFTALRRNDSNVIYCAPRFWSRICGRSLASLVPSLVFVQPNRAESPQDQHTHKKNKAKRNKDDANWWVWLIVYLASFKWML